jgi:hypothetical protein
MLGISAWFWYDCYVGQQPLTRRNPMNVTAIAIDTIIVAHDWNIDNAATAIFDYTEDPAVISSPSLIDALDVLLINAYNSDEDDEGYGNGFDLTAVAETIFNHNPALAVAFAALAELCPNCFSDLDVCADDDGATCRAITA